MCFYLQKKNNSGNKILKTVLIMIMTPYAPYEKKIRIFSSVLSLNKNKILNF